MLFSLGIVALWAIAVLLLTALVIAMALGPDTADWLPDYDEMHDDVWFL